MTASLASGVVTAPDAAIEPPSSFVADAVAVFVYEPLRSAATTVWVAGQLIDAPGTSDATGTVGAHGPSAAFGSDTVTFDRVAVPAFATVIVYEITSPVWRNEEVEEVLVTVSLLTGVETLADAVVAAPPGAVADAEAVFVYEPARSAATTVCVAGHVIVPPGGREATGSAGVQVPSAAFGSVTETLLSDAVPGLVTVIV